MTAALIGACLALAARPCLAGETDPAKAKFFRWKLGSAEDLDGSKPASFTANDRVGGTGEEAGVKFRLMKPNVYQCPWVMPAFDFDPAVYGSINHVFYLTFRFKDVANAPMNVWAGKGGDGFYGKGFVGLLGGSGDGQWKEETIVIRRSMMRCMDGKTFTFSIDNVKGAVPVEWMLIFSADAQGLDGKPAIIKAAGELEAKRHEELRKSMLPKCNNLGLPDPGACPEYTAEEKTRGFRVFFPPLHRQLFENSNPRDGEMSLPRRIQVCPGEVRSVLIAVRALKDVGKLSVSFGDLTKGAEKIEFSKQPVLWARYSEQKIGSSWGKDYRVCPDQLSRGEPAASPARLEIACVTLRVPEKATAGDYSGTLTVGAATGGKATVPFTARVYPFKLEHPEHCTHGLFYYIDYADASPMELDDMRDHGMDTIVGGMLPRMSNGPGGTIAMDMAPVTKCLQYMKKAGFRAPLICNTGGLTNAPATYAGAAKGSEQYVKAYASVIEAVKKAAEAEGFPGTGFFPVDEPHSDDLIAVAKDACTWTRQVQGAKTYITSNPKAVSVIQPVLDYVCYNLSYIKPETVDGVKAAGATLMFYCPSFDVDPERNRFRAGFYLSKLGAHSAQFFAYQLFAGDPFFDMDGPNRDWNVVYPSMDSPVHDPTLAWDAMREGVNDYMYAHTLRALAERLKAKGDAAKAAEAQKILDEVLAPVDIRGESQKTPELAIEANVGRAGEKIDPELLKQTGGQMPSDWYELARLKIAEAVMRLGK